MRVVLDTCILKLATFPAENNASALIYERAHADNRFLECALAANVEFIVTVNTAPGHFDRKQYQAVNVVRPGEFLKVPDVARLVKRLTRG